MSEEHDRCPSPHPDLLWRLVDDELVIVRPIDGEIRVLNRVGAFVWRSMDGQRTVADLACLVTEEYQVSLPEACSDIHSFLAPLTESGLVEWNDI